MTQLIPYGLDNSAVFGAIGKQINLAGRVIRTAILAARYKINVVRLSPRPIPMA